MPIDIPKVKVHKPKMTTAKYISAPVEIPKAPTPEPEFVFDPRPPTPKPELEMVVNVNLADKGPQVIEVHEGE